ncbi:MAG: putative secreted protein [Thermoleophilia bacterium]|nr:putative secreted protein [Thermoleophilia bacterium]
MGTLPAISTNVQTAGTAMTGQVALPRIDGAPPHDPPFLDRVGDTLRDHAWVPIVGGVLGAAAAGALAIRGHRGLALRIAAPITGAVAGAGLALSAAAGVGALRGAPSPAAHGPVASPTVEADEDLRVMTFNLHGGMGPENELGSDSAKLDRMADAIRREHPDVVLLQEVDRFATRSNGLDTVEELARRLHPDGVASTPRGTLVTGRQEGTGILTFGGTRIADARGLVHDDPYGDGVLRRLETGVTGDIRAIHNALVDPDVPDGGMPDYFPRVTSDAMLVTPAGNHVRVLAGHYNGPHDGTDYEGAQVDPTAATIGAWDGPTVWGADWNVSSGSSAWKHEASTLGAHGLTDSFDLAGIGPDDHARDSFGDVPRSPIDRIYASEQFTASGTHVAPYPEGEPGASDHHPVVTDLHLHRTGITGG